MVSSLQHPSLSMEGSFLLLKSEEASGQARTVHAPFVRSIDSIMALIASWIAAGVGFAGIDTSCPGNLCLLNLVRFCNGFAEKRDTSISTPFSCTIVFTIWLSFHQGTLWRRAISLQFICRLSGHIWTSLTIASVSHVCLSLEGMWLFSGPPLGSCSNDYMSRFRW